MDMKVKLINNHVIGKNQIQLNVIRKSQNDFKFDFRFKSINLNKRPLLLESIQTLSLISTRIPHGIIIICPNFKILNELKYYIS